MVVTSSSKQASVTGQEMDCGVPKIKLTTSKLEEPKPQLVGKEQTCPPVNQQPDQQAPTGKKATSTRKTNEGFFEPRTKKTRHQDDPGGISRKSLGQDFMGRGDM